MHYLLLLAMLQVGSMLIGLTGFVHMVVKGLLQMRCMLCMSLLLYNHSGKSMLLHVYLIRTGHYEVLVWAER